MSESFFDKKYEGMWFLLGIPGIMIVLTVIFALTNAIVKRFKKKSSSEFQLSDSDFESSVKPAPVGTRPGLNVDPEENQDKKQNLWTRWDK